MARLTDSLMYRRTYDALARAGQVFAKVKSGGPAQYEFEQLAIDILLDDPTYRDVVVSLMEDNGLESMIVAQAVVVAIANRLHGGDKPRGSSGEVLIAGKLESLGIRYEREKSFDGLSHIGRLRFDFYLTDLNIAIEYHGKQHFEPVGFFGGIDTHNGTILRDEIKRQWCAARCVRLIEIRYDDDSESIDKQLAHGLLA